MGIKTIVTAEALAELPEALHEFYQEDNKTGDFILDVEGFDDHPTVRGVITANKNNKEQRDKLRAENEKLSKRFAGLPDDFSAKEYDDLKAAAEAGGAPTEEQISRIRDKFRTEAQKEIDAAKDENQKLHGALNRMTVDDGLSRAMDGALIDPLHKPKLIPFLKGRAKIDVEEVEGQFRAVVDTDMGHQTLTEYVNDWASSDDGKPYVAKSGGPNPNGSKGGPRGPKTISRADYEAIPFPERKAAIEGKTIVD
jgi:hypothetical protein